MLTDLHRPVFLQVDELREEEGVPRRPDRDPVEARGEEAKVHRGSIYGLLRGELAEALALPGVVIEGEDGALVAREEVVPEADRQVMRSEERRVGKECGYGELRSQAREN